MKHYVDPKQLRLRIEESHHRLGVFLKHNAPPFLLRTECLQMLHRIVGEQKYNPNLKTVCFVVKEYFKYWWNQYEFRLWCFSHEKIYHRTNAQIDAILCGEDAAAEEEWPDEIEEAKQ